MVLFSMGPGRARKKNEGRGRNRPRHERGTGLASSRDIVLDHFSFRWAFLLLLLRVREEVDHGKSQRPPRKLGLS